MRFLTRKLAAEYLNRIGVPIKGAGLKDHANRGTGPKYAIINGSALYMHKDLDEWVAAQASRSVARK